MKPKINEENIKNNRVFCIDRQKTFTIKSIQRSVFLNPAHENKIRLFFFYFCFWISVYLQNHDETDSVSEQFRKKKCI